MSSTITTGFSAAVSGAQGYSARVGASAQNLANVGVVSSKFHDIMLTTISPDPSSFTPAGVSTNSAMYVDTQGAPQLSSVSTHMAIQGKGFFPINTSADKSGSFYFTRNGTFAPDANGNFVNNVGQYLLYVPTDALGNPTGSSTTNVNDLSILNQSKIGQNSIRPTENASLSFNLPSSDSIGTSHTVTIPGIFDSLGNSHNLLLTCTKDSVDTANHTQTWNVVMTAPAGDPATFSAPYASPGFQIVFNGDGSVNSINGGAAAPALSINWNNSANNSTINLNLGSPNSKANATCTAESFTLNPFQIDGNGPGSLTGITTDNDGFLRANYTSGSPMIVGRLSLATFPNANGLTELTNNTYEASADSGPYVLNFANSGSSGSLLKGQVEGSTIDMADVITTMIVDSMRYKSNLKTVSSIQEMFQALDRIGP